MQIHEFVSSPSQVTQMAILCVAFIILWILVQPLGYIF